MDAEIKSKKTGGRQKGTPNKSTILHREFLQNVLDAQTPKLKRELSLLHEKDHLKIILSCCEYILRKLQTIDLSEEIAKEKQLRKVLLFFQMAKEFLLNYNSLIFWRVVLNEILIIA